MKRLSKMAYELRDVTIFYEKHVNQYPARFIAGTYNRSTSRICQILKIQMVRFKFYAKNRYAMPEPELKITLITNERQLMLDFYHYEIGLILQRYYIRMKKK